MEISCKNNGVSMRLKIDCPERVNQKFERTYHCKNKSYKEFGRFGADRTFTWDSKKFKYKFGKDRGTPYKFFDAIEKIFKATAHIQEFKTWECINEVNTDLK